MKKIIKQCPDKRQTLFFSATMPKDIVKLSQSILTDPERVQIDAENSAAETVEQKIYSVRQNDKKDLLVHILQDESIYNALVFTRTKFGADKVERHLRNNKIKAEAIHGNKSQAKREKALERFKKGKVQVLVATDIASRGIDVDVLDLVVNFELPNLPESYVHRIGRTGRAGNEGLAISFCNEGSERNHLAGIQKLLNKEIEVVEDHPFALEMGRVGMDHKPSGKSKKKSRSRDRGRGRGGYKEFDGPRGERRGGGDDRRRDDRRGGGDDRRRDDRRRDDRSDGDNRRRDDRRFGGDKRRKDNRSGGEDRRRDENRGRKFESSGFQKRVYKSTEASASENKTHFKKKKKRNNKYSSSLKSGESSGRKPQIGRRGAKKTKFKGR